VASTRKKQQQQSQQDHEEDLELDLSEDEVPSNKGQKSAARPPTTTHDSSVEIEHDWDD
jgi:hypothetical protein